MPDYEGAWIWPEGNCQPPRDVQLAFRPVEYGTWFPARRVPWWRRWRTLGRSRRA